MGPWTWPDIGIIKLGAQNDSSALTLWTHAQSPAVNPRTVRNLNTLSIQGKTPAVNHWREMLAKNVT